MDAGAKALDLLRYPKVDADAVRTQINAMQDLVFSAQRALGEADDENRQLRRQLDDRQEFKALQQDLDYEEDGGFYVRKSEREAGKLVPYCATCWGETQKLIPLKPTDHKGGHYFCLLHKVAFITNACSERTAESISQFFNTPRPKRY